MLLMDDAVLDHSVFTTDIDRPIASDMAAVFFEHILKQAKLPLRHETGARGHYCRTICLGAPVVIKATADAITF